MINNDNKFQFFKKTKNTTNSTKMILYLYKFFIPTLNFNKIKNL